MTEAVTLCELRKAAGLTQSEVARLCGVSQEAVHRWEAGKARPTMDKLPALSTVLGVSIDALVLALTN